MTESDQILLKLIKSSLFGSKEAYPEGVDWDEVLRTAMTQTVAAIAAVSAPEEQKGWEDAAFKTAALFTRNLYEQDQVIKLLSEKNIPFAILKGTAAAIYYPVPSRRTMGDIDFIVPEAYFNDASALLSANGYSFSHEEERHISYSKNGIEFELHRHFSDPVRDIGKYIKDGLLHTETATVDGHTFPMLPKLANGLVLLSHLRSHLDSGLGLRQIVDWMMYVYRELDDEYWGNEFKKACDNVGLTKLALTVTRMCRKYLGLPEFVSWCDTADESLCDTLMENVLISGNFGRKQGEGNRIETVMTYMRKEGFFTYLQRAGEVNWKAYHKHNRLRPFAWIYQIGRYLKQGIQSGRGKKTFNDLDRGKNRYELLKKLDLL